VGADYNLGDGDVVIAAITSCTNTSNPNVLIAAGLVARKARALGPDAQALGQDQPGARLEGGHRLSRKAAGPAGRPRRHRLQPRRLWLHDLYRQFGPAARADQRNCINTNDLVAVSVLSGNRNFEGRVNPDVRANYLASPPLVVAYAIAGTMHKNLATEPLGRRRTASRST
jgi:aconitate hydratase